MSDLKRKASSEVDASEEPNAKRHQSGPDPNTMDQEQIINSVAAWNLTEEATVDDASPDEGVSAQDTPAHDAPAQVTPAPVTPPQRLEIQGMPSQDVHAQVVTTLNTDKEESKPRRKSVETDSDKSARQLRIESMVDPGQNVRERGTVQNVDGDLRWVASDGTLVPCVYHNSIRAELIAEAGHNGTLSYDVTRRHGNLEFNPTDITAYHPEQKSWSEERSLWPRIRDNILNRLERKQYKELYAGQDPGKMMHNGRLVVDHDNHPVYMFPDLPATISSAVEGWWLEAITRLDSRIDRMDIRARLPAFRGKTDMKRESKLYGLSAIGNKRLRFREREGLIAWDSRVGSDLINQFFKSRLPAGCVERNTTEGGRPLSPGEVKHFEGIKKCKAEHADNAKGPKMAKKKSPSPDNAAGPSSAQNCGHDGPASEIQAPTAASSVPPRGQQPQHGPPLFGAPGAHTPGFAPQIQLNRPTSGSSTADIPVPRGLTPAQVLGRYQLLSNLTGQIKNDFQAAIEAINDEEQAYASLRPASNNRGEQNGRVTRGMNEFNASEQTFDMQPVSRADEHADHALSQPHDVQRPSDTNSNNKNIIDLRSPSPSTNQSTSAVATSGHQPSQQHPNALHNTIGDEGWAPPSEEIDEAFWEETMNNDWHPAVDQNNDQLTIGDAQPGLNDNGKDAVESDVQAAVFNSHVEASRPAAPQATPGENHASLDSLFDESAFRNGVDSTQQALQLKAPQVSSGEHRFSPDASFEDLFGPGEELPAQQAVQLEPIQPGSGQGDFSPDPQYDPFASEDNKSVPTQPALQDEAPKPCADGNSSSQDPLFNECFAEMVPELTPEAIQDMGVSLGLSGDFANYLSPLLDQEVPEEPLAPAETAMSGSKRKTMDEEPSKGNKKARLPENLTSYTPYQPRQDQTHARMQHPRSRRNQQSLPAYVSPGLAPPLAIGSLPTPTATPEKRSTSGSSTLMPPPRRQPLPANPPSLAPPASTNPKPHGPGKTPSKASLAQPRPYGSRIHQSLPPYQSLSPFPASHSVPPTPTAMPSNAARPTTAQPSPSQPITSGTPIDHRYSVPTDANQMALVITLLEPTLTQFQGLIQGTPFADHIVDTDMVASYMNQYQQIVRELEMLWGRLNWVRSALPTLSVVGPISADRWEGQ